jgi:catechol 2,3-dioxygenase-like lactoylglutathione lyase family enzyme
MAATTGGIHHITLRVNDLDESLRFYRDVVGFDVQTPEDDLYLFAAGQTVVILRRPLEGTPSRDRFSEYRRGVDHVAFAVDDRAELDRLVESLRAAGVETQGVEIEQALGLNKEYVCFRDPDNVQLEFFMQ